MDASDHLTRIFLFSVLIFLTFYTNRVFIYRLKENENQATIQKMVLHISAEFVNVSEDNLDGIIEEMLQLIGKQYKVDRIYLCLLSEDRKTMVYTHEWSGENIDSLKNIIGEILRVPSVWFIREILDRCKVNIQNINMLPAGYDRDILEAHQAKSFLALPVVNKGRVLGFLGFEAVQEPKEWREDHLESLHVLVNILADALVRVDAEREIKYLAYHDSLTGLANRMFFINRLKEEIQLAKGTGKAFGVILIDLDSFKNVNDSLGHDAGDEVLKQVSGRIYGCLGKQDLAARLGGDEFVLMLGCTVGGEDAARTAHKLVESFRQPLVFNEHRLYISVSAGIALFPQDDHRGSDEKC